MRQPPAATHRYAAVVGTGAVFEYGKLWSVTLLGRHEGPRWEKAALITLVAVLMALNASGA